MILLYVVISLIAIVMTSVIASPSIYTQNARADSLFPYLDNAYGQLILDLCTPLRLHMDQLAPSDIENGKKPTCPEAMYTIKSHCDLNTDKPLSYCSDPRYENWLVNDYNFNNPPPEIPQTTTPPSNTYNPPTESSNNNNNPNVLH